MTDTKRFRLFATSRIGDPAGATQARGQSDFVFLNRLGGHSPGIKLCLPPQRQALNTRAVIPLFTGVFLATSRVRLNYSAFNCRLIRSTFRYAFHPLEQIGLFCHCFYMSTATAHLLAEFEKLPIDVQREFSDAILHRSAHFDYDAPSDEELTAAAREVFSMLDREEDADASSR